MKPRRRKRDRFKSVLLLPWRYQAHCPSLLAQMRCPDFPPVPKLAQRNQRLSSPPANPYCSAIRKMRGASHVHFRPKCTGVLRPVGTIMCIKYIVKNRASVSTKKRRSRQEILEMFRACQSNIGRTPGAIAFCRVSGVTPAEVKYYWPRHSALAEEAGGLPNEYQSKLPDEVVFEDYARVCNHFGKIPTIAELRIAQRELGTRTQDGRIRYGHGRSKVSRVCA